MALIFRSSLSSGGGGGTENDGGYAGEVIRIDDDTYSKIQKINTGVTSLDASGSNTIRNALYDLLMSYFPDSGLQKDDYGDEKAIFGPGLNVGNCLFVNIWANHYRFQMNEWAQRRGDSYIFTPGTDGSGQVTLFHIPVRNGFVLGVGNGDTNSTDSPGYMKFSKAFIKDPTTNHIIYMDSTAYFMDGDAHKQFMHSDLMVAAYPYLDGNCLQNNGALIRESDDIISMSKMIYGINLMNISDMYTTITSPYNSSSLINEHYICSLNGKEFIALRNEYNSDAGVPYSRVVFEIL